MASTPNTELAKQIAVLANEHGVITKIDRMPEGDFGSIFSFGAPRPYSTGKGGHSMTVNILGKNPKFQTPVLYTPFGTDTRESENGIAKSGILCTLRAENKNTDRFESMLQQLQDATVDAIFQHRDALGFQNKSKEVIAEAYLHPLLQRRPPYDAQVKARLIESDVRLFERGLDGAMTRVDGFHVPPKSNVVLSVRFGPVWVVGTKFGIHMSAEQIVLLPDANKSSGTRVPEQLVLDLDDDVVHAAKKARTVDTDEDEE